MILANESNETPMAEKDEATGLNVTEYQDGYFPYFTVLIQIVYVIIVLSCLCGLVGNMKIIWILSSCNKRSSFATYILNLAVVDLGALLGDLAYDINMALVFFNNETYGGFELLFVLADVLVFFTYCASFYLLTAIGLEMALCVLFPVWSQHCRPGRSSAVISFLLWIFSGALSGIVLLCYLQGADCGTIVNSICTVNFLMCTLLIMVSSLTGMTAICCKSWRYQPPRLYVTILITNLVFILFGLPLSAVHLFFLNGDGFPLDAKESSIFLVSFISSIIPLIYYLNGRGKKRQSGETLKVVLRRLFEEEADAREELGNNDRQGK
ncbi:proto-oncogene Mas-like [Paroedura picta]|uniref:proto-oncogene Mas-like n=1 Tax=Paroedura picta TaxID=143630 RepID=UPI004057580F